MNERKLKKQKGLLILAYKPISLSLVSQIVTFPFKRAYLGNIQGSL